MNHPSVLTLPALLAATLLSTAAMAVPDGGDRPVTPPIDPPGMDKLQQIIDAAMPQDVQEDNSKLLATCSNHASPRAIRRHNSTS